MTLTTKKTSVYRYGDSRPFDVLTISPQSPQGTQEWRKARPEVLAERVAKRQIYIQREIDNLMSLVNPQN